MALAAYRNLLRSTKIAFQGDSRVLHAARQSARQNFNEHRLLAPSSAEAEARIAHAEETALVLRRNVVQGERVDGTEAGVGVDGGKYQLRIHSEIERGDNTTIKRGGGPKGQIIGECCAGSR
ncbi:Mitochondrial zinc maintenance protein 1, mitochondrial [Sticta canariensis]|nr:Mitochondrial zinc maintenance protein 1, mitochondrial [Sticta canariensis]